MLLVITWHHLSFVFHLCLWKYMLQLFVCFRFFFLIPKALKNSKTIVCVNSNRKETSSPSKQLNLNYNMTRTRTREPFAWSILYKHCFRCCSWQGRWQTTHRQMNTFISRQLFFLFRSTFFTRKWQSWEIEIKRREWWAKLTFPLLPSLRVEWGRFDGTRDNLQRNAMGLKDYSSEWLSLSTTTSWMGGEGEKEMMAKQKQPVLRNNIEDTSSLELLLLFSDQE